MTLALPLPDLAATAALARKLAPALKAGDTLALYGPLGAGKTSFARALLQTLGISEDVPSPTFTLLQSYDTPRFPVYHFDLYRLKSEHELEELGWNETADGLVIAEWPERAGTRLPENRLALRFAFGGNARAVTIEPHGAWAERAESLI